MLKKHWISCALFVLCTLWSSLCSAGEVEFGGVHFKVPSGSAVARERVFSGSTPSKAWVIRNTEQDESVVSAIVTEGIVNGLRDHATTLLVKLYVEAFVVGWGGKVNGPEEGELAAYCGGEAGYHLEATFGNDVYDYYGCMKIREGKGIAGTVVTWIKRDKKSLDPEGEGMLKASKRIKPLLEGMVLDPYEPI